MFNRPISLVGTGLAVTLLGGCLGTDNPDFNKQAIEAIQFVNGLEDLPETEVANIPTGFVEYRGVATLNYDEPISSADPGTDLFADIALNVISTATISPAQSTVLTRPPAMCRAASM